MPQVVGVQDATEARKGGGNRARVKADPGTLTASPSAYSLQSHTEEIIRHLESELCSTKSTLRQCTKSLKAPTRS